MTTHMDNASLGTSEQKDERHGLFRKQAVEKQQDRLLGDVLVIPPLSYSIITITLILFVTAAMVLLINGSYARKETVQGFLVPNTGVLKVYASRSGIVREIFVKEGDKVVKDQALVLINGDQILANGDHLETLMLDEYFSQRNTLSNQLSRLPEVYAGKANELTKRVVAIKSDLKHLTKQRTLITQQLDLASRQLANMESLADQALATQSDADAALEKVLSLKSQLQEIARTSDAQKITLETLQLQSTVLSFEQMDSEDQLEASLSAIAQSITQLYGQQAYILKASSAGVVSNIQISEGQEAHSNIPLLTLTPEGSELEAELLVPARAIGFVEKDQTVKIRYSAFSFQKFGQYDATITNVSQTVLLPNELTGLAVNAQEPMYRVTAKLAQQNIDAYGQPLSLKEGISLEADIKLAERTLLEWLFEPLFSLKGRL
ncbi:HlyD family secretion protein [Reinekea forsetii]|nr:HlyD family secretion protein [Reinekea forsetii]